MVLEVKVLESTGFFMDSSLFEKLPMIIYPIKPGQSDDFKSEDFENVTSGQY
jgi:hypothetical protein